MNEKTGKTASVLAITEKKPQRPGGCVGIFFQLFDWNRRFAKKKLFSRKLLPPARTKASKKFGGDEKMPKSKLHLIADENSGGFPNMKKNGKHSNAEIEQKHEMRAPGLVARLMGLESMPAVSRDKSNKKALVSSSNSDVRNEKMVNSQSGANVEDLALEKGSAKMEPRPQKIQKIEPYDRRVVTRFGAEALQIRSVLSRSKKYHHQKFVSSVKSPRISSARNASRASRLIDAAAKILEPGLQVTNRACSLDQGHDPENSQPLFSLHLPLAETLALLPRNTRLRTGQTREQGFLGDPNQRPKLGCCCCCCQLKRPFFSSVTQ